jgi:predicted CXXCH cytochrome family protein
VLHIGDSNTGRKRLFRCVLGGVLVVAFALLLAPAAAYPYAISGAAPSACEDCHSTWPGGSDAGSSTIAGAGPHGYYRVGTHKCVMCHTVHKAPSTSVLLLQDATIQAACFTCHDNTGALGVYSAIVSRGGWVASEHSIEATTHVPGGSVDLTRNLSCPSCHSVHRATTMAAFRTDRRDALVTSLTLGPKMSNALLRDDVGGKAHGTYTVYGADWCAGCHDQRHSDSSSVRNHPVEASTTAGFFYYGHLASVISTTSTTTVILGDTTPGVGLGYSNLGYVMPYPRTTQQGVHKPICQQCHEDARSVGVAGAALPMIPGDVSVGTSNPVYYSFPHQTTNMHMVVEEHDDLCSDCHPAAQLP